MRALLSVSDKAGIVEFAKGLERQGWDIISTGGTYIVQILYSTKLSDPTGLWHCETALRIIS